MTDHELNNAVAKELRLPVRLEFCADLNACAIMEAQVTTEEEPVYLAYLDDWKDRRPFQLVSAKARERCIAFLRTRKVLP